MKFPVTLSKMFTLIATVQKRGVKDSCLNVNGAVKQGMIVLSSRFLFNYNCSRHGICDHTFDV